MIIPTNKQQLEVLMKEVRFIKDGDTAVQIIPIKRVFRNQCQE